MAQILVVDDDPDIRNLIARIVEAEGHVALKASNTTEAVQALQKGVDMVFLDVDMPGDTGVSMVLRLRARGEYQNVPIVFVTAYLETVASLQNIDASAVEVITKPFYREDILEQLRRNCG